MIIQNNLSFPGTLTHVEFLVHCLYWTASQLVLDGDDYAEHYAYVQKYLIAYDAINAKQSLTLQSEQFLVTIAV